MCGFSNGKSDHAPSHCHADYGVVITSPSRALPSLHTREGRRTSPADRRRAKRDSRKRNNQRHHQLPNDSRRLSFDQELPFLHRPLRESPEDPACPLPFAFSLTCINPHGILSLGYTLFGVRQLAAAFLFGDRLSHSPSADQRDCTPFRINLLQTAPPRKSFRLITMQIGWGVGVFFPIWNAAKREFFSYGRRIPTGMPHLYAPSSILNGFAEP